MAATTKKKRRADELPAILKNVQSSTKFLARLSFYAQKPIANPQAMDKYVRLTDWWWRATVQKTEGELVELILALEPEIAKTLDALRDWTPPPPPMPGTSFAALYTKLANAYLHVRERPQIRYAVPGPLDARHPGFEFAFDPKQRMLVATEKSDDRFRVPAMRLAIDVPAQPGGEIHLAHSWISWGAEVDAWELFALRQILIALSERTDPSIQLIAHENELGRLLWEHVLEQVISGGQSRGGVLSPNEEREWTFCLSATYQEQLRIFAFSRSTKRTKSKGDVPQQSKYKKQSWEALLSDETASALEREIARLALCTLTATYGRGEATLTLGTAQGHELAKRLAEHPRVVIATSFKANPEEANPLTIMAGTVSMRLEPRDDDKSGELAPRFLFGEPGQEQELPVAIRDLHGREGSIFRGGRVDDEENNIDRIISIEIPGTLRPWIEASAHMGDALTFPTEALPRLLAVTSPLVATGTVQLPRRALGEELRFHPQSSLRVEWIEREDGEPIPRIEVMITPHPEAPMIEVAQGPRLFTFIQHAPSMEKSRRVFVERDHDEEEALARRTAATMKKEVPAITWNGHHGHTATLEGTLALAQWLDRNPLKLPIEIRVGRPPKIRSWASSSAQLRVERKNQWLAVDGSMETEEGDRVSLGEVLEAARQAKRFVKAKNGVFIELHNDVLAKLQPLAAATDLQKGNELTLNEAFGIALTEAASIFAKVKTGGGIDLDAYRKRFEERLLTIEDDALPKLDHGELRPYQKEGVAWILRLASWAPGCVLADDMGLGKTIQTAAILKARAHLGPALVIAPASVASNWTSELARFVPSITENVRVISYGLLQRQIKEIGGSGKRFATVVVDEAQYVKNTGAQRSDAVRSLERDFTIALTGTPLENHLGELWSIIDIAFPGLLGEEALFRERFRKPIEGGAKNVERLAALARLVSPFLLRRTRRAVLTELPPREEITEYIDLGPEEKRRYLALRQACENELREDGSDETGGPRSRSGSGSVSGSGQPTNQLRIALLAALTRLRQLACDVRLVDPTYDGPTSTKIARTVEIARELANEGNRALVFSQFTSFLSKVRDALAMAGLRVGYLSGETPSAKRKAIVDAFQDGEYDVFCISLLAGGTGLNLTNASYVIHLDPWWNPAAEEQATSRAYRMGQTSPVTVYRLVARGTIEEAVLALHADKRDLASAVLEGKSDSAAGPISPRELFELLRFGGGTVSAAAD